MQLVDMFVYDLPRIDNGSLATNHNLVVYNFHSVKFQQRFFFTVLLNFQKTQTSYDQIYSITELFPNANWLEREMSELHGIFFMGKKDLRNLMLVYGDTSSPMQKSFPSIGLREIFYDSTSDLLIQTNISIQF